MQIEFEELAAHCREGELSGVCSIMQEAEAVCKIDDPNFEQDCDCCEEHCPLKISQDNIERNQLLNIRRFSMLEFQKELTELINKHSLENGSNTPDFILAEHLCRCLSDFEQVIKTREAWYGRKTSGIEESVDSPAAPVQHTKPVELASGLHLSH